MDKIIKLALDFQAATDDMELRDMELRDINSHIQMYLFNMLGIDCGKYWAFDPRVKNANISIVRDGDIVKITLGSFSKGLKGRYDTATRAEAINLGIGKIICEELKSKFKETNFDVRVGVTVNTKPRW